MLSIHLKLSERTTAVVRSRHPALMKPCSILVNTSRSAIVEEGDLAILVGSPVTLVLCGLLALALLFSAIQHFRHVTAAKSQATKFDSDMLGV